MSLLLYHWAAMAERYKPGRFSNLETRAVLAGRYKGRDVSQRELLTHTYDTDARRTLCNTVPADSLADRWADDIDARPTCSACLSRDPRFK